jgi:serine/threonine-protein kinase
MICPRCSIAEIRDGMHQCPLCEFTPNAGVLLDEEVVDEVRDAVQHALPEWYRIDAVERLGERSFVYRAWDLSAERDVALKVIPVPNLVDHELAQRYERYVSQAAALRHAHIVTVTQFGTKRAFLWYAMDLVRGRSLSELLRESGPMELEPCLRIVEQVASALDFAHRNGVLHGNLKPSNILLDAVGWVRVSDFAVLEAFGPPRAAQASAPVVYRPEYLAPERFIERTTGASADQYALAVIVYQCLTGTLPFVGDAFEEVARQHAEDAPPRLSEIRSDLPVPTMEAVQRALSKVPALRFPSVLDFTSALSGTGRRTRSRPGEGKPEPKPDPPVLLVQQPRRLSVRTVAVAGLVVIGGLLAASAWASPDMWRNAAQWVVALVPGGSSNAAGAVSADSLDLGFETGSARPGSGEPDGRSAAARTAPQPGAARASPSPSAAAVPGVLVINSRQWGRVVIDGAYVGNTPLPGIELSPGIHSIRVERDGYTPYEGQVDIVSRDTVRLTGIVLMPLVP